MATPSAHWLARLLGAPPAATRARGAPNPWRHHARVTPFDGSGLACRVTRRRLGCARVRSELALSVPGAPLRRPVHRPEPGAPLLVARDRGAVLRSVPADRGGGAAR